MGGSSLAPEVYRLSNPDAPGLTLHVLDSTEPLQVLAVEREIDVATTLFIVSSKSGGTIEPNSLFKHFHGAAARRPPLHRDHRPRHRTWARWRASTASAARAINDPDIGGRYSRAVVLRDRPAALAGVDVRSELERRGRRAARLRGRLRRCGSASAWARWPTPAATSSPSSSTRRSSRFGLWVEQLIAESTGKQGKGVLPIADEPLGAQLRRRPRLRPHRRRGDGRRTSATRPLLTDRRRSRSSALFFDWEFAVAVLGWALGHQPVRPAQRAGGQGQHQQGAGRGPDPPRGRRPRRAARRPRARRTTSRSWATCPTTRRSTPRSRACARS